MCHMSLILEKDSECRGKSLGFEPSFFILLPTVRIYVTGCLVSVALVSLSLKKKELDKMTSKAPSNLKHFLPLWHFLWFDHFGIWIHTVNKTAFPHNFSFHTFLLTQSHPCPPFTCFLSSPIPTRLRVTKRQQWPQTVLTGPNAVF